MRISAPSRGKRWFLIEVFVCLIYACTVNADSTCKIGCSQSDNGLLKYLPGNVYEYAFDSILTIGINAGLVSQSDDTSLKVVGNAKIYVEGNCGYTLQLDAVKVTNTKESIEKKILKSIEVPVQFTIVNGKVLPEICADPNDASYSLNIKRGVISLLQTNTDSETEVDVFGQCPTHTSVTKTGSTQLVTKIRNLNGCAYREGIKSGIVSGVVNEKAGLKSTIILQADYLKEVKIEHGLVENVQLVENYKLAGATKGNPDVHAKVVTSLRLKNQAGSAGITPATSSYGVNIIFQHQDSYAFKNIAALKLALSELIDLTSDYIKKNSAKQFVELIRLMRNADTETLLELGAFPHPNKVLARKVYLDALFRTNTAQSAKAILKQLNKLEENEKIVAILSLNLVNSVDKETLDIAASLLVPSATKEIYLSIGKLVSKYCSNNDCSDNVVQQISKKFIDNLKYCKASTKKEEERIIYILKGISNTGNLANNAAVALAACASVGHSNRIRVAAIQAFAAVNCNSALRQKSVELLRDHNEDSELRIEAYLAAINCPTAELANEIAEIVNSETVNQVGGFIASNLKSIRDSTDSTRETQRHYLSNIRITKQFPKDYRRYSFNNEISYKLEALGLSASTDYKLIYSQSGFLPRSARLNLTTEVFGTNFNVFEGNVRQENLESLLEYYVGPKGLLNKDFDEVVKLIEAGGATAGGRARRSIADDSAKFAKKYKSYGSKSSQDLNLDLSLKLFGSELTFLSLGDNIPSSLDDIIRHFSVAVDKSKKELSAFNKEFVCHSLFLDTELTYPTGVGIPLEFSAQGFAANKVDFAVNIDVDSILQQNWQRAQYRMKFVPSIDINVNVQIGFNAHVLSTGLRVGSTAHSATGSDVNIALFDDKNSFNVDIELPRDKLELINIQVNTELFVAEKDKPLKPIALKGVKKDKTATRNENCFNQLEFIGLGVCFSSSSSLTEASSDISSKSQAVVEELHLSRPFNFQLYLKTEKKYNLKGTHVSQTASGSKQWKLDFSTPGSKVVHDTSLTFELGTKPRIYGRVSFDNPQFHIGLEAGLSNDNKEFVAYGQYEQSNDIKRSKIGFIKNGNEYHPIIEIQDNNGVMNNINGYRADGKVIVHQMGDKKSHYTFENFQIINPDNERVVLNGWADVSQATLETELHIAPGQQSYLVKSNFNVVNNIYAVGLFVNDERSPDNVYGISAEVSVADQAYALKLKGKAASWTIDSTSDLEYVKSDGTNVLASTKFVQGIVVSEKNRPFASFNLKTLSEINKFELAAEATREQKLASINLKFYSNQHVQNDYALEANIKFNKNFIGLLSKCDFNGNLFVIDNMLTTSWGTLLTAKGEIGQRFSSQDIHIDLQGSTKFNSKDKPTQWLLKIIGSPDKTSSEFHLNRENSDLVKFTGETQHPQDKVSGGKLNLIVKNVLTAKSDFKFAKNGKGELFATIETQKTDPKHKVEIESKFHIQAPKYDVETTLTFDADKKLFFKTENILDKTKFTTKNVAENGDKKISFEANGNVKGEWRANGEILGNFALVTPDGRLISGNIKRKIELNTKSGTSQGNMEVQLTDQESKGGKQRSLLFSGKLERLNTKTSELVVNSKLVYSNLEDKKFELNYQIKHLMKGHNKAIEFSINTQSNFLNTIPIDVSLVIDEYNREHAIGRVSAKYGDILTANVNVNYNVGGHSTPASYELQGNLQMPESTFKTFEISSHGKLLKPNPEEHSTAYIVDIHVDQKVSSTQFIRLNSKLKGSEHQGSFNFDIETNAMKGPLKVESFYQREKHNNVGDVNVKQKLNFNYNYAEKYVKFTGDINYAGTDSATLHYTLDSSFESAKKLEVDIRGQKAPDDAYLITVQTTQNSKKYNLQCTLYRSIHKKGVNLRASLPSGNPIVIFGTLEVLSDRKAKLIIDIDHIIDLDLKLNTEVSFETIDDFSIIADWNSKRLKLEGYKFELRAQNKSVNIQLKTDKSVIFEGSATYSFKKEKNKSIIEGQGQIRVHGKAQSSNFKLTRQVFEMVTDNEVGFSYTFNGNLGPKNGVSTLKITNKDFNVKLSVCEEKKQCTNIQVQSILTSDERQMDSAQHLMLVLIDLRELGYPHEFELHSKTIRQGFKYEYNLDANLASNNNLKYQLLINVQPTYSKLQLKLPKREILFETTQKVPPTGQLTGHYEYSISFYDDKLNKPNDITRVVAKVDVSGVDRIAANLNGELKFEHPKIRALTISGKIDTNREHHTLDSDLILDIFSAPEQKIIARSNLRNTQSHNGFNITSTHQLLSSGLQLHYELNGHIGLNKNTQEFSAAAEIETGVSPLKVGASMFGSKDHLNVVINTLDEEILLLNANLNKAKHLAKLNAKMQLLGLKPVEINSELEPMSAKINLRRSGLVEANFDLKLGKELTFNLIGAEKQLLNGRIALDAVNFLQSTYTSNDEDVKSFLNVVEAETKKETETTQLKINQYFEKLRQQIDQKFQLAKNSHPDLTQLKNSYKESVNDIINELQEDPTLAPLIEAIRALYTKLTNIFGAVSKVVIESFEKFHENYVKFNENVQLLIKDAILPAWEKLTMLAAKFVGEMRVSVVNGYTKSIQSILSLLEKYGPILKNYGKAINEALKPIYEVAQEFLKVVTQSIEKLNGELKEYLAKLPTFEAIRTELNEEVKKLKIVQKTLEFLNNLFDQLRILPQTPEITDLLQKIQHYLETKLKQQSTNDNKLLEELFKSFLKALRSVISAIEGNLPSGANRISSNDLHSWFSTVPHSVDLISNLPLLLTMRYSLVNYLLNENWNDVFTKDLFKSWLFFHDFELRGHLADGHQIFTFDGQHFSYPGNCKYILAQDSVDNNFTIIAQLNNGKLKTIIMADRDGNNIEAADTGMLKLNGNIVEYPQYDSGFHAWRLIYTIHMTTEYGVNIMCTVDLKLCHIHINGFYTSKTRGLLGNGNAEPYDDFLQNDGTLAVNSAAFGNSYGLGKCSAVAFDITQVETQGQEEICNDIFGLESPLAISYLTLDARPYRKACNMVVQKAAEKDKETSACTIALAYGSALKFQGNFALLPPTCLKCHGAPGQRDLGEEITVKIPNKQADIVFVVDVNASPQLLTNLVAPAISEIRETLKIRGFTDVQVAVIAFNESLRYPALLTSNSGKINYQGNFADVQLKGPKPFCDNCIGQVVNEKRLLEIFNILERVIKSVVPQSEEEAFKLALEYPFRAGAAKSIIGVRSDSLDYQNLWKFIRAHFMGTVTKFNGAFLHLLAPVKGLSLEGVPSEKLIGFNSRLVATIDGKGNKKRAKLQFENDMGVDFVLNNGGWIFNTQHFDSLKSQDQKKVLSQVTSSIADTLFKTEIVSECRCLPTHGLHAQHKCIIKSSNFVPNKKPKVA